MSKDAKKENGIDIPFEVFRAILGTLGATKELDFPFMAAKTVTVEGAQYTVSRGKLEGMIEVEHRPHGFRESQLATSIGMMERNTATLEMAHKSAKQRLAHARNEDRDKADIHAHKKAASTQANAEKAAVALERAKQGAQQAADTLSEHLKKIEEAKAELEICLEAVHAYFINPAQLWAATYTVEVTPEKELDKMADRLAS